MQHMSPKRLCAIAMAVCVCALLAQPATAGVGQLSVSKVAGASSVSAGDTLGSVITATNSGATDIHGVAVTDTLPSTPGLSWSIDALNSDAGCSIDTGAVLNCTWGTLAPAAAKHVHVTSPTTKDSCAKIDNSAAGSSTDGGASEAGDSVTVNCGDIGLAMKADALIITAGNPIGFVISAGNGGAGETRGVMIVDTLPDRPGLGWSIDETNSDTGCWIETGVLNCDFGTLNPTVSKRVHVTSATVGCDTAIVNSADVTTTNAGSAQAGASTTLGCAGGGPGSALGHSDPLSIPLPNRTATTPSVGLVTAPAVVGDLRLTPTAFAAAPSGATARAAKNRGTFVTFSLSQPATVLFTAVHSVSGRRTSAGSCVKTTRANRSAPACTRVFTERGGFTRRGNAGSNRFRFSGRMAGHRLKAGHYRLVATPRTDGVFGTADDEEFRILP